jgi:hypothetical protein
MIALIVKKIAYNYAFKMALLIATFLSRFAVAESTNSVYSVNPLFRYIDGRRK